MKLKRYKKVFLVVSLLVCLFTTNIALFSIPASANYADNNNYSWRTIGAPVYFRYYSVVPDGYYPFEFGVINRPNVYYYDIDRSTYGWYEGSSGRDQFNFTYSQLNAGNADIFLHFYNLTAVDEVGIDSAIAFSSFDDLNTHFNFTLGISEPSDAAGGTIPFIVVGYTYTFLVGSLNSVTGEFDLSEETVHLNVGINVQDSGYAYIPLFNRDILTDEVLDRFISFRGLNGLDYAVCLRASFEFDLFSDSYFIEPVNNSANSDYESWYRPLVDERLNSILEIQTYDEHIIFEDIDWTDWIVNAVSGFLDFQIVPNLSFGEILGLLIGMSLFILFLKIFAGG